MPVSGPSSRSFATPSCRTAWLVIALGLPLAGLVVGCLSSSRVGESPADRTTRRSPIQPVGRAAAQVPASWIPRAKPRIWKSIVLHHTATDAGSVASIHAAHRRRTTNGKPWLGIGYHFVIGNGNGMPDGAIEATFRWKDQLHGAHAGHRDHNQHGIGIALVGHFDKKPPTQAQLAALKRLLAHLQSAHDVPGRGLVSHGDIKATACPGRLFPLARLKAEFAAGLSP